MRRRCSKLKKNTKLLIPDTDGEPKRIIEGTVVAAREVLYIVSLLFATTRLPVFLLLDLRTVWAESAPLQRFVRMAMYILTPHNYVALCCAARFPTWRRAFLGLAATQVIADLSSCFALAALLASTIEENRAIASSGDRYVGAALSRSPQSSSPKAEATLAA